MPVVGFLHYASPETYSKVLDAFRQGLQKTGYVEGRNVAVEYRWADGHYDRLPALAAELVRQRVTVIAAGGTVTAKIAKQTTSTIPIVFTSGEDPVEAGLVDSISRPKAKSGRCDLDFPQDCRETPGIDARTSAAISRCCHDRQSQLPRR